MIARLRCWIDRRRAELEAARRPAWRDPQWRDHDDELDGLDERFGETVVVLCVAAIFVTPIVVLVAVLAGVR